MKLRKSMCCLALLRSSDAFISYSGDLKLAVKYPHIRDIFSRSCENITKFGQLTSLYWVYLLWFSKVSIEFDSWRWNQYAPSPVRSSINQTEYSLFSPSGSSLSWICRNWTGLFFCKPSFQSLLWHQTKITSGSAVPTWSLTPVYYCLPGIMHTGTEAPWKN